jgi:hypothetical protein
MAGQEGDRWRISHGGGGSMDQWGQTRMALTYSIQLINHYFIQPRNPRNNTENVLYSRFFLLCRSVDSVAVSLLILVMESQLGNQQCITIDAIHHAMFIGNTA